MQWILQKNAPRGSLSLRLTPLLCWIVDNVGRANSWFLIGAYKDCL